MKGEVPVIGWIEGPLAEACDLAGVSNMLLYLMVDPDFSNRLMDKCVKTARDFAEAICSQIDADTYNRFVKERQREIIDFIHEKGARVKLHICGNILHLLPSLADLPIDILDIDHMVDLQEAYKILGSDIIRCGNIDPVYVRDKTHQEIFNACEEIRQKETGRRFILSAGCEICVDIPLKNLQAMREAL